MKEELKMFSKKMYEMLLKKSFCLGAIIVILYFLLGSMQAFLLGSMLAIELLLGQRILILTQRFQSFLLLKIRKRRLF